MTSVLKKSLGTKYPQYFLALLFLIILAGAIYFRLQLAHPFLNYPDETLYFPGFTQWQKVVNFAEAFGHPPLFNLFVGVLSPEGVYHTRTILILCNSLIFPLFYLISYRPLGHTGALALTLSMLFSPLIFTHIGKIVPNFFLVLFGSAALYAYQKDKMRWWFFFLLLACLTRESALAFICSFLIIDKNRGKRKGNYLTLFGVIALIFINQRLFSGSWINNPGFKEFLRDNPISLDGEFVREVFANFKILTKGFIHVHTRGTLTLLVALLALITKKLMVTKFSQKSGQSMALFLGLSVFLVYQLALSVDIKWALIEYFQKGWMSFQYWRPWLWLYGAFLTLLALFPTKGWQPVKLDLTSLEVFSLSLSFFFLLFFSFYRDTYIRDILACGPFLTLALYSISKRLLPKPLFYALLLLSLFLNMRALTYPVKYEFPLNIHSL